MKINKRKIFSFLLILLALIITVVAILFFSRESLLEKAIAKVETKLKLDYNCNFTIKQATFEGLSSIAIEQINLVPIGADTLVSIEKIKTKINLFQLLTGDVQIENLEMQNGFIQLVRTKEGSNFAAFLKSKSDNTEIKKRDYAELAYNLINKGLNLIPETINMKRVALRMDDKGNKVTFQTDLLQLKNHELSTQVYVFSNTMIQNWDIKGMLNPRKKIADVKISSADTTQIKLPYIDVKYKLLTSFDNLHFKVDNVDKSFGKFHLDGFASVENLTLNNHRIANKNVVFKNMSIQYNWLLGSDFIALDNTSIVQLNDIKMNPYLQYNTEKDTTYTLKVDIKKIKAQDFINSLPVGLFTHFEGMQAEGDFDYNLNFQFNKNKPWKLIFDSKFNKENLRITKYGEANLAKLNTAFTYRAIENGRPQRPILVGSQNPYYTPIDEISPYLQKCVLTCEDPSFMRHHGFINEAFKQSIIKNIRTKKFSRGASTISMQLIKNVFLTREKTLSRKLEEILLVYILENNRIASKQRMLEVYFNVIEWGPNVYGIGEAAEFYFQKAPINLNLQECLFLASIVPKPKKFMSLFNNEGNLKPFASKHAKYINNLMLRRGLLTTEDTINQNQPLVISGTARSYLNIKTNDSIAVDPVFMENLGDF